MIPKIVKRAVGREYTINYLGKYQGKPAYNAYIEDCDTGFPKVIVIDKGQAVVFNDFMAVDIISTFQI